MLHGWPSGLRRQTQAIWCFTRVESVTRPNGCSGIVIDAWVRIPLRAQLPFLLDNINDSTSKVSFDKMQKSEVKKRQYK
ncbi:unnamed protein product [Litomosoides sigmodontis]|uniref:Uncharacterized protein n=1 Tax=Litomosoides sigmodontis TaxID=42156 RepID=A0A3P6SV40_LITSI|nr:unnamed protein product [Litomosoides sigmodontis]